VSRGSGEFESPGERDETMTPPRNVLRPRFSPQALMRRRLCSNAGLSGTSYGINVRSYPPTHLGGYGILGGALGKRHLSAHVRPSQVLSLVRFEWQHVAFWSVAGLVRDSDITRADDVGSLSNRDPEQLRL